jgi:hypothetical protein
VPYNVVGVEAIRRPTPGVDDWPADLLWVDLRCHNDELDESRVATMFFPACSDDPEQPDWDAVPDDLPRPWE